MSSGLCLNLFASPETKEKLCNVGRIYMWPACLCAFIQEKLFFDINGSTEFLCTQMRTFLANLFENSLCKSHARR